MLIKEKKKRSFPSFSQYFASPFYFFIFVYFLYLFLLIALHFTRLTKKKKKIFTFLFSILRFSFLFPCLRLFSLLIPSYCTPFYSFDTRLTHTHTKKKSPSFSHSASPFCFLIFVYFLYLFLLIALPFIHFMPSSFSLFYFFSPSFPPPVFSFCRYIFSFSLCL